MDQPDTLPPAPTSQKDLITAGQRRINLIWELTQAFVAIVIVMGNVVVSVNFGISGKPTTEFPVVLSSSLFLVLGFYFSRTNHADIGGTAAKPSSPYEGR